MGCWDTGWRVSRHRAPAHVASCACSWLEAPRGSGARALLMRSDGLGWVVVHTFHIPWHSRTWWGHWNLWDGVCTRGSGGLFAELLRCPLGAQGLQEAACEPPIFRQVTMREVPHLHYSFSLPRLFIQLCYAWQGTNSGYKLSPDRGFTFPFPIVVKTGKGCCRTCVKRTSSTWQSQSL